MTRTKQPTAIAAYHHQDPLPDYGQPNPEPGNYYVTTKDGSKTSLLVGPFEHHEDAIALVGTVTAWVNAHYPWSAFWSFGTCGIKPDADLATNPPQGVVNQIFPDAPVKP